MRLFLVLCAAFVPLTAMAQEFTPPSKDAGTAAAGEYVLDKSHASVSFEVSHLGFAGYVGRFNSFDAKLGFDSKTPAKSTLSATIDMRSLDVNNSTLEAKLHDKDFFDSKQFPEAKFVAKTLQTTGADTGVMEGELTLKNITKPVRLKVVFNGHGKNPYSGKPVLGFSAAGSFKRSDFGLTSWLPAVGDEVALRIEAEFTTP